VNANLLFTWRRAARAGMAVAAHAPVIEARVEATPAEAPRFIPLGVFGQTGQAEPALMAGPSTAAAATSTHLPLPRSVLAERAGVIEIDLPDGTRLRLDTLVNERALRRVLSVLKGGA
jgi:transposase